MPTISYRFELSYAKGGAADRKAPEISAFSVIGGAARTIHNDSPDSISIGSEFEQARQFKNIMLFMPGSAGAGDMKAALDLTSLAVDKTPFFFYFTVTQLLDAKMLYQLSISDVGATLKKRPQMVLDDLLMCEFNLPGANITHMQQNDGEIVRTYL
jgi:hypothetical protein